MIQNKTISFILAFIISGIISGSIYVFVFIKNLDLFGLAEIQDPEGRDGNFFYTWLAMVFLTVIIFILFFRNNRKYAAVGVALPNLIGLFLLLKFGIVYVNKSNYYQTFDKETWLSSEVKPIKMARSLINDKALIGLTKEKVIELLGTGRTGNWNGKETISYESEHYSKLGLTFEKGKLISAYLWVDD